MDRFVVLFLVIVGVWGEHLRILAPKWSFELGYSTKTAVEVSSLAWDVPLVVDLLTKAAETGDVTSSAQLTTKLDMTVDHPQGFHTDVQVSMGMFHNNDEVQCDKQSNDILFVFTLHASAISSHSFPLLKTFCFT